MEQYIPKSTLLAEIERIRRIEVTNNDVAYNGALDEIKYFLNTLELKEMDLENIAAVEWDNSIRKINGDPDNAYFLINRNDYIELTKHLFKLILKAQKGE